MKGFYLSRLLSCSLFFLLTTTLLQGQKVYSLDQCIKMVLANNELVKNADLQIEAFRQMKKNSSEIPKTSLVYTQGQFNSIYKYDNNFTISQTIPNPVSFHSKRQLADGEIKSGELHAQATRAEIVHQTEVCYHTLWYTNALHDLIVKQDSIYNVFSKDAAKRYSEGKGSLLEKITAETQAMESKDEMRASEEDIENFRIELQTLMQISEPVEIRKDKFDEDFLNVSVDSNFRNDHPLLQYYRQQISVSEKISRNESAHIGPDLSVGYFNQSIYGPANIFGTDYFLTTRNRLQGFQVGLALPLWFAPMRARVQTAKINTRIAESEYQYQNVLLMGQYRQAVTLYLKYHASILDFKSNIIVNFNLILEQALTSYQSKTITSIEYLQIISHAIQFKKNYLNIIHQNNIQALKVKYLLSR